MNAYIYAIMHRLHSLHQLESFAIDLSISTTDIRIVHDRLSERTLVPGALAVCSMADHCEHQCTHRFHWWPIFRRQIKSFVPRTFEIFQGLWQQQAMFVYNKYHLQMEVTHGWSQAMNPRLMCVLINPHFSNKTPNRVLECLWCWVSLFQPT